MGAEIDLAAWELPPVFKWLAATGGMAEAELLKTFNCGIGMIVVVASDRAEALTAVLEEAGETVSRIGSVTGTPGVSYTGSLL
jgi:phosphoribosylformylglycinamidine cyclo-ligase